MVVVGLHSGLAPERDGTNLNPWSPSSQANEVPSLTYLNKTPLHLPTQHLETEIVQVTRIDEGKGDSILIQSSQLGACKRGFKPWAWVISAQTSLFPQLCTDEKEREWVSQTLPSSRSGGRSRHGAPSPPRGASTVQVGLEVGRCLIPAPLKEN